MQKLPLEGIRVVDFTQVIAGPHITQWLGVMGAEVIKIESELRPDVERSRQVIGAERLKGKNESAYFIALNYGKKDVVLNMKQPRAIQLAKELIKLSDIVTENFGGPVLDRWGLGYPELKEIKPDIIVYAGSGYGRTGPYRESPAFANIIDAFVGLIATNGYENGVPGTLGPGGWTDLQHALHGTFAILAALYHRSKTGEGQYIDAAMTETSANLLGERIMDYMMNDRTTGLTGNRDNIMAPHNCYRCKGEDNWVAIAISSQKEWKAFCDAIGNPDWVKNEKFSDELSRWKNQNELDRLIGQWTINKNNNEVTVLLQKYGVPAGASLGSGEIMLDPHLKERGFFVEIEQPMMKKLHLAGLPCGPDYSAIGNYQHAPMLGEHNDHVFGTLLGISKDEIAKLIEEDVIF